MARTSRVGRRLVAAAIAALASGAIAAPAGAVVGGTPTGSSYANVGLLSTGCSGTLVSPTVVLTAAHCTDVDAVQVTFAPDSSTGPWIAGTAHGDPAFLDAVSYGGTKAFLEQSNHDIGVVVLDHPAADDFPGITPAPLPALGALDSLDRSATAKRSDAFTLVGYGSTRSSSNPHSYVFDATRRVATGPLFRLDPSLLWIKSNPNASWGGGNPCFGDSGGPAFVTGSPTVVGVVSFGKDPTCQNGEGYVRVDTVSARTFLAAFVALP